MKIEKTDCYRALDYVPVVSSFKNVVDLAVLFRDRKPDTQAPSNPKSYSAYVKTKSPGWCALLLIPVVGNLIFFFCGPKTKKIESEPESVENYPIIPFPGQNRSWSTADGYRQDFNTLFEPTGNFRGAYESFREDSNLVAESLVHIANPQMRTLVMTQFIEDRPGRPGRKACKYVGLALRDGGEPAAVVYKEFLELLKARNEPAMVYEISNRLITHEDTQLEL